MFADHKRSEGDTRTERKGKEGQRRERSEHNERSITLTANPEEKKKEKAKKELVGNRENGELSLEVQGEEKDRGGRGERGY